MMYNNWGYGLGFGFGWIFMLLFWGLIIWGVIALVRGFSGNHKDGGCCGGHAKDTQSKSPQDILDERYAKGEIDKEEYEEKKNNLKK